MNLLFLIGDIVYLLSKLIHTSNIDKNSIFNLNLFRDKKVKYLFKINKFYSLSTFLGSIIAYRFHINTDF